MPQTLNNEELKIKCIIYKLMYVLLALPVVGVGGGLLASCADSLDLSSSEGGASLGTGELVQFAAGTTVSSVATRADGETGTGTGEGNESGSGTSEEENTGTGGITETKGKTYYMPDSYRFVCRMYYKASTSSNKYDVSGNTDVTAWLKVKGNVGNSLYWRNSFAPLDESNKSLFDTYGNDATARMFYWQNRKEHAFLAWTDLNRATNIGYDPTPHSNTLKFQTEDTIYVKRTGEEQTQWIDNGYEVRLKSGGSMEFGSWASLRNYVESGNNYNNFQSTEFDPEVDFTNQPYYYAYGWSCKYRLQKDADYDMDGLDVNHRKYGWYEYQMFYDKLKYEGDKSGADIEVRKEKNVPAYLYNTSTNKYLAEIEIDYFKTDEDGNLPANASDYEVYTYVAGDYVEGTSEAPDNKTITDGKKIQRKFLLCGVDKTTTPATYYYINADGSPVMESYTYYEDEEQDNPAYNAETNPGVPQKITVSVPHTGTRKKPYEYTPRTDDTEKQVTVGEQTYTCIQRTIYVAKCQFAYNLTDEYGNVKYDETKPRYTFYYKLLQEQKKTELIKELPANVFDLTHSNTMTSINGQPDIAQALTIQAPLGATQNANRVNLYFKHQFSQVQVNVKTSSDLSVVINRNHIQKVELLGVSEKGFVFTELDEDGNVEPTTYESVDVSKYSDEHLQKNQYGTAFNMFDMYDASDTDNYGYTPGYIKSYNALTFGQLQAIRITWNEQEDGKGITHESTYHVADEELKNLKSGRKYVWNIELRRGTLAIVRTEIVDWIVPQNELEYETDGTIYN